MTGEVKIPKNSLKFPSKFNKFPQLSPNSLKIAKIDRNRIVCLHIYAIILSEINQLVTKLCKKWAGLRTPVCKIKLISFCVEVHKTLVYTVIVTEPKKSKHNSKKFGLQIYCHKTLSCLSESRSSSLPARSACSTFAIGAAFSRSSILSSSSPHLLLHTFVFASIKPSASCYQRDSSVVVTTLITTSVVTVVL